MGSKTRWLALAVILVTACPHALAQDDPPPWTVQYRPGWGNSYRPERWLPLSLTVQAPKIKKAVGCTLNLVAQQDSMTNMTIDQDFTVTPGLESNVSIVAKVCNDPSKFDLRIRDDIGRVQWEASQGYFSLEAVPLDTLFIGVVRSGARGMMALDSRIVLSDRAQHTDSNGRRVPSVVAKEKAQDHLPWDWTGYDCLDLLILHDLDWKLVNETRSKAIAAWVNNGGKLLIVLGSRPLPPDHALTKLLPFAVGPARQITLSPKQLGDWHLRTAEDKRVATCWTLPDVRNWRKLALDSNQTFFTHGPVGFGQVGVAAFTPAEIAPDAAGEYFYADVLGMYGYSCDVDGQTRGNPDQTDDDDDSASPTAYTGYSSHSGYESYRLGPGATNADNVLGFLQSIPEMRPLSIWWIIGLLSLLAVVLGPLDYFVLKRLDRMPMTWITSAGVIVLFSIGAYYGVERIRGGLMHVRAISVTDAVQGQPGSCWSTTISGIFAPSSDSYHLTGPKYNQWWSSLSPSRDPDRYYRSDREEATRTIDYRQGDGGNLPAGVPINIWSMQCLLTEMQAQTLPMTAKIDYVRVESKFHVKLDNQSDMEIANAFVRLNVNGRETWIDVGPVKARDKAEVWTSSFGRSQPVPPEVNYATLATGTDARTRAMERYHKQGAAIVYAYVKQAPLQFRVEGRDGTENHQHLLRLVVPNVTAVRE